MITAFYISSAVAIIASITAITRRDAMHGILYLILMLLAVASLFVILGAHYVATLQVIIYAGAIVILFLFVIMMVNPPPSSRGGIIKGWFGPLVLAFLLGGQWYFLLSSDDQILTAHQVGPREVALRFFTDYAFALPLIGLFLLIGIIGAFHLGRDDLGEAKK